MPRFGVHCSIAGGFVNAVREAARLDCDTLQLFCKSSNQWNAKPISPEDAAAFRTELAAVPLTTPLIHNAYLINIGTAKDDLYHRSVAALIDEMRRAATLGIKRIVIHPGTPSGDTSGDIISSGLRRIASGLDEVFAAEPSVTVLLETTAGQGDSLGWRFEHLAELISLCRSPERLGVCFDTCHVFAAGYPLATPDDYEKTMAEFDSVIGIDRLVAFHLNDSVKGSGSRVDRHAAIGDGMIGEMLFRCLVNDPRFASHPMYLETPKGTTDAGDDLDMINLQTLRRLIT